MMADSTVFGKSSDISKLKVVELKRELKSRGLSTAGDKSELQTRLQTAVSKDSIGEDTLDSDELDSDGVLDDEDEDKSVADLIGDDIIINESEVTESSVIIKESPSNKPDSISDVKDVTHAHRTLKRRLPPVISSTESINEDKLLSPDTEPSPSPPKLKVTAPEDSSTAKKIVLNRVPITAPVSTETIKEKETPDTVEDTSTKPKIIKITMDSKDRLEMRAKRFGLPPTEDSAKEARKARFGVNTPSQKITPAAGATLDVLKKRAERFGTSVSKVLVDVENKERLEKRKAKFSLVKT